MKYMLFSVATPIARTNEAYSHTLEYNSQTAGTETISA